MISKAQIQKGLHTKVVGKKLFVFESIDSTNACAKTLAETGSPAGTVVVADFQTSGRGRLGRTWESEPGANLLFSVVLRPSIKRESAGILAFFSAVFIARALERVIGHAVECKWPNDILLNGRKFCGILLENSFVQDKFDFSIIGIGINVNQSSFKNDLDKRATSLSRELGHAFDRAGVLQELLREADALLPTLERGDAREIMQQWTSRSTMFGKTVTIAHGEEQINGTALRLNGDGGLVIETPEGLSTFYAGDVTLINNSAQQTE